jgi:hypothetical protein
MANTAQVGQRDQVLNTGRIAYGKYSNYFLPVLVDSSGNQTINVLVTETTPAVLQASTAIAASTWVKTSETSVVGYKKAAVFIDHARAATAAFGTNGTEYRVEFSAASSGDDKWIAATTWNAGSAVCSSAASSSTVAVGAATCVILSGTAMTIGDIVYVPSATAGNDEWWRVAAVSGTASFTILDASAYSHAATTAIFGGAERKCIIQDVEPFTRMRVVINNNASGTTQAIQSRVMVITEK